MQKIINSVIGIGVVVLSTIASFIVRPPIINSDETEGLNWKNIAVFVAGTCTFICYKYLKPKKISLKHKILAIITLIALFIIYEILYYSYSVPCYDNRIVISYAEVIPEYQIDWQYWKKDLDYEKFLQGANCSSVNRWFYKDLALPYYSFISLYLSIIIAFIVTVLVVTENRIQNEE